jgi:hypothetical protein
MIKIEQDYLIKYLLSNSSPFSSDSSPAGYSSSDDRKGISASTSKLSLDDELKILNISF